MLLALLREYCLIKLLLSLVFHVDDFLTAGPPLVVHSFLASLQKMWEDIRSTISFTRC